MIRESYIERMIRQLAQLLAGMVGKEKNGDLAGAQEDLERAYTLLLGEQRPVLDLVDSATLCRLFGPEERLRALARVCYAEARLMERQGDGAGALKRLRQARDLYAEVGAESEEERAEVADLLSRAGV